MQPSGCSCHMRCYYYCCCCHVPVSGLYLSALLADIAQSFAVAPVPAGKTCQYADPGVVVPAAAVAYVALYFDLPCYLPVYLKYLCFDYCSIGQMAAASVNAVE